MAEEEILGENNEEVIPPVEEKKEEKVEVSLVNEEEKGEGEKETLATKDEKEQSEKEADSLADADKGAPEKYEEFALPDGFERDDKQIEEASVMFKDMGLSQENAQKLVDFNAAALGKLAEAQAEAWETLSDEWAKASKDDKDFGGTKFNDSMVGIKQARDHFGNDKFMEMLDVTGVGNHPEMLRFMHKVGSAIKDDAILHGGSAGGEQKTQAEIMFPGMATTN